MAENPKSLMISGESGTGKTLSLMNIRNHKGVLYINCEGGKPLPFKNDFKRITIDDPKEIFGLFDAVKQDTTGKFHTIVIDTVSFMMDRFEAVHVHTAANTMKAWADYGKFYKTLIFDYIAKADVFVILLGHLQGTLNEDTGIVEYSVPVKGALKNAGLESYMTTVVSTKKVKVKELEKYTNALLNITDRDRELGYKHVFQTRTTKQTVGDRLRSPLGLFSDDELYIDNDAQLLMSRLNEYYN